VFEFQQNFLSWTGRWTTAPLAIPQIMLFLALLFLPQARIEGKKAIRQVAPRIPKIRTAALGMFILFIVVGFVGVIADRVDVRTLTLTIVTALVMVSLVPLTGWSKQISLAQITFVGAGAFAYLQWAPSLGTIGGLAVAALFAVPFGVAMALPALRLQGLYLALASMAFAQMAAILFFPQPEILGFDGKPIRSIQILGFDFSQPFHFLGIDFGQDVGTLLFCTAALGVVGVLVVLLHKSRFGRRLNALGDSPAACATVGINPITTKLIVFIIASAIAGFAGALLGIFQGTATVQDFEMLQGLAFLLLLVVGGVAVVSGAVLGGFFLSSFTWISSQFPGNTLLTWWSRLGPGLAGIGIGRQPSGIIPTVGEDLRAQNARKRAEREAKGLPPAARPDGAPPAPSPAGVTEPTSVATPGA
jgi:branched-chain amino acid transport system permease protein